VIALVENHGPKKKIFALIRMHQKNPPELLLAQHRDIVERIVLGRKANRNQLGRWDLRGNAHVPWALPRTGNACGPCVESHKSALLRESRKTAQGGVAVAMGYDPAVRI